MLGVMKVVSCKLKSEVAYPVTEYFQIGCPPRLPAPPGILIRPSLQD